MYIFIYISVYVYIYSAYIYIYTYIYTDISYIERERERQPYPVPNGYQPPLPLLWWRSQRPLEAASCQAAREGRNFWEYYIILYIYISIYTYIIMFKSLKPHKQLQAYVTTCIDPLAFSERAMHRLKNPHFEAAAGGTFFSSFSDPLAPFPW